MSSHTDDTQGTPHSQARTPGTEKAYLTMATRMQHRYVRERAEQQGKLYLIEGVSEFGESDPSPQVIEEQLALSSFTWVELAIWYADTKAPFRKAATIRLQRSALRYAIEQSMHGSENPEYLTDCRAAIGILTGIRAPKASTLPKRTSAKKKKSIPVEDLVTLCDYLRSRDSRWAIRAERMLLAGIVAGLRPSEWDSVQARHTSQGIDLTVVNAKATNGRGNGETRTLSFVDEDEVLVISNLLTEIRDFRAGEPDATFKEYTDNAGRALRRANKALWPKRSDTITLYSGRHQFSANKKASGASRRELADMMGHGSDETAGAHYGKRRSGWARYPKKSVNLDAVLGQKGNPTR